MSTISDALVHAYDEKFNSVQYVNRLLEASAR